MAYKTRKCTCKPGGELVFLGHAPECPEKTNPLVVPHEMVMYGCMHCRNAHESIDRVYKCAWARVDPTTMAQREIDGFKGEGYDYVELIYELSEIRPAPESLGNIRVSRDGFVQKGTLTGRVTTVPQQATPQDPPADAVYRDTDTGEVKTVGGETVPVGLGWTIETPEQKRALDKDELDTFIEGEKERDPEFRAEFDKKENQRIPFDPDWRVPPGEILSEIMKDKNISSREMRDMLGLGELLFIGLLNGHLAIDMELADKLAAATPMPAQFWLNLQKEYERPITPKKKEEEPLIDPDCRDGKCGSCIGGPCQCPHHQPKEDSNGPNDSGAGGKGTAS